MRKATLAVLVASFTAAVAAQSADAPRGVDLQGKLYRSVFSSGPGSLAAADLAKVPEPLRGRLRTYLDRRAAFKSAYKNEATSLEMARADAKRRALERSMVALIDVPGIEQTAAAMIAKAPVFYEWEGRHNGPLDEAQHAEDLLKKEPSSPLAPWFYAFIAHRQRAAFEAYESQKNQEGMRAAAKKYRAFIERSRAVPDPIFAALIDDMERQPFVYLKTATHPKDFNPDA